MAQRSPLHRSTVGPLNKADAAFAVDVTIDGLPASWVSIRPTKAPDVGLEHGLGINVATPLLPVTIGSTSWATFDIGLLLGRTQTPKRSPYLIETIYLKAGADATSFEVLAQL